VYRGRPAGSRTGCSRRACGAAGSQPMWQEKTTGLTFKVLSVLEGVYYCTNKCSWCSTCGAAGSQPMWQEKTTGLSSILLPYSKKWQYCTNVHVSAAAVLVGQQVLNPCGRRRRQVCHSMCFPYLKEWQYCTCKYSCSACGATGSQPTWQEKTTGLLLNVNSAFEGVVLK
jgi:hypothetical protein